MFFQTTPLTSAKFRCDIPKKYSMYVSSYFCTIVVATEMTTATLQPSVEETTHNKVHQIFRCAQEIWGELLTVCNRIKWHGHQHLNKLSRTTLTSLIWCLQKDLLCPNKSTGTSSQLFKILFWVDGWVLTEVKYNVRSWQLTTVPRPCKLFRKRAGLYNAESKQHKNPSVPRMKKDEDDVHKVKYTIERWENPFKSRDPNEPLSIIASAVKAADDIADHLLTADQKGNDAFHHFHWEETANKWHRLVRFTVKGQTTDFPKPGQVQENQSHWKWYHHQGWQRLVCQDGRHSTAQADIHARWVEVSTWTSAMVYRNSRWCPCEDRKSYPASHLRWKGWSCWSCAIFRCVDPGWNCFATTTEILPQDIQRASQLRASLGKIDLVPAQHSTWSCIGTLQFLSRTQREPTVVQEGPSRSRNKMEARNAPHSGRNVCVITWISTPGSPSWERVAATTLQGTVCRHWWTVCHPWFRMP